MKNIDISEIILCQDITYITLYVSIFSYAKSIVEYGFDSEHCGIIQTSSQEHSKYHNALQEAQLAQKSRALSVLAYVLCKARESSLDVRHKNVLKPSQYHY